MLLSAPECFRVLPSASACSRVLLRAPECFCVLLNAPRAHTVSCLLVPSQVPNLRLLLASSLQQAAPHLSASILTQVRRHDFSSPARTSFIPGHALTTLRGNCPPPVPTPHVMPTLLPSPPFSSLVDPSPPLSSLVVPCRPFSSFSSLLIRLVSSRPFSSLVVPSRPFSSLPTQRVMPTLVELESDEDIDVLGAAREAIEASLALSTR